MNAFLPRQPGGGCRCNSLGLGGTPPTPETPTMQISWRGLNALVRAGCHRPCHLVSSVPSLRSTILNPWTHGSRSGELSTRASHSGATCALSSGLLRLYSRRTSDFVCNRSSNDGVEIFTWACARMLWLGSAFIFNTGKRARRSKRSAGRRRENSRASPQCQAPRIAPCNA